MPSWQLMPAPAVILAAILHFINMGQVHTHDEIVSCAYVSSLLSYNSWLAIDLKYILFITCALYILVCRLARYSVLLVNNNEQALE